MHNGTYDATVTLSPTQAQAAWPWNPIRVSSLSWLSKFIRFPICYGALRIRHRNAFCPEFCVLPTASGIVTSPFGCISAGGFHRGGLIHGCENDEEIMRWRLLIERKMVFQPLSCCKLDEVECKEEYLVVSKRRMCCTRPKLRAVSWTERVDYCVYCKKRATQFVQRGRAMNSAGALRRRIQHEDVGGRKYEGLKEPLLGQRSSDDDDDDREWRETTTRADQAWTHNFSRLLAQWAQWFSTVVLAGGFRVGSNLFMAVLGRQLNGIEKSEYDLSPVVVGRLKKLQERLAIPFDGSLPQHQDALKALWQTSFPERVMPGLVSPQWKDMGWQGNDPSTDFRGGGFISLENLLFLAHRFPVVFQKLLHKEEGKRAEWEYPFAVAGLNITFMLIQLLDLRAAKPSSPSAASFFNMLATDENAFDLLYCVAFQTLDAQWLAQGASYMEFNAVLGATRKQLERELVLEDVDRVADLPSYISLDLLERISYPAAASTV